MTKPLCLSVALAVAALSAVSGRAQVGAGWLEYSPARKVHLENFK
jgi:hypothetical protein